MIRILKYFKKFVKFFVFAMLFMFCEVMCDLRQPYLMSEIIDVHLKNGDINGIVRTGVLMLLLALVGLMGGIFSISMSSYASQNFGAELRSVTFRKIQQFSFTNIDKFKTASLITRLTNDIFNIQNTYMMIFRMLARSPFMFFGGIILAMQMNPRLGTILILAVPLIVVAILTVFKFATPLYKRMQLAIDKVNSVMQENLIGARVVKAFVKQDFEGKRFAKANKDLRDISERASVLMVMINPMMMLIMNFVVIGIVFFGGKMAILGRIDVGKISAFITYSTMILNALVMMSHMFMHYSRAEASAKRVLEVLDEKCDIVDPKNAKDEESKTGEIEFKNVSFRYSSSEKDSEPVLKNISLKIESGSYTAILGGTGSGKSTLVNLIPRLYEATEGEVLVGGKNVKDYKIKSLRESIGMVLQSNVLFSGTIESNIRWGKKEASFEEIEEAARISESEEFIKKLPNGYSSVVNQGGLNLSGGQKQRLCIARALIKKPKILIMDDSTGAVDTATESRIRTALRRNMGDMTCVVIAQRISSVIHADKIVILENGEIAGIGTHEELIKNNDTYKDIYYSQQNFDDSSGDSGRITTATLLL